MTGTNKEMTSQLSTSAVGPSDGCTLELSADGKWMRLIVSGKLTAAFNVEYVRKTLGEVSKESQKRVKKNSEIPVSL